MSAIRIIIVVFKLTIKKDRTYNKIIKFSIILIIRIIGIVIMIIPNKTPFMYLFIVHSTSV